MAVRIRMKRTGTKNCACFRIEVTDARSSRDGRTIESVGFYDPRHNDEKIEVERVEYWISQGAQPSETVMDILRRAKEGKSRKPIPKHLREIPKNRRKAPPKAKEEKKEEPKEAEAKEA
ncbi:MAG: 30S ribosomal protein S16 [Lentisphaerae bacterium GWF2_52_8]|nr:MAG: 30S ribosomal protein S16 [Lentisphaerae bacterium GWF2_52_8]